MMFEYRPVQKPKHKRLKPKRGQHTEISDKVRKEVDRRAAEKTDYIICERCGCSRPAYRFEKAHLENASQYGTGRVPWNIANLCGPKTQTGTCHQIADETAAGRAWKRKKREELIDYYSNGAGRKIWPYDGT